MDHFWSPNEYGGDRRIEFNGINKKTAVDQMYVARSRGQPPSRRNVCKKEHKSSSNNSASLVFSWYNNSEQKRKRRMTKYKIYAMEGKVKKSFKKCYNWIKKQCFHIVHGYY
ncbi:unnamed protein product [Amaranthus hypochondriacus]